MHNGTLTLVTRPFVEAMLARNSESKPGRCGCTEGKGFVSADTALYYTGRTARVQCKTIRIGNVALFSDGGVNTLVGEIYWFASIGDVLLVCLSAWQVKKDLGRYRKVAVEENCSIIPSARLLQAMIFTPTDMGKVATVIMPTL